jgi:hypothetical protein
MKDLFELWVETGVPHGVKYPRTQSGAVGWSCPQFGIVGVGSKREFNSTHAVYGPIVKEISALTKRLRPVEEVLKFKRENPELAAKPKPTREYKTQKARRVAAEDETKRATKMLESTLKQLQESRQKIESAERDLAFERRNVSDLQKKVFRLETETAELKRMLAAKSGVLQLVE